MQFEQQVEGWQLPIRVVVVLGLAAALFLTPWAFGWFSGVFYPDIPKLLVAVLVLPLLLSRMPMLLNLGNPCFWVFLLAAWTSIRAIDQIAFLAARTNAKDMVFCALVFIALGTIGLRPWAVRALTWAFVAGCSIAVLLMLAGVRDKGGVEWVHSTDRVSVEGYNANFVAYCCCSGAAMIALLWMFDRRKRIWGLFTKLVYASAVAFLTLGVVLPATRGGAVALAAMLCVVLLLQFAGKGRNMTGVIVAILAIVAVGGVLLYLPGVIERFQQQRSVSWDSGRFRVWGVAWDTFLEYPFIGVGTGQFPYLTSARMGAHNGFLAILAELGGIGMFLFIMFGLTLLKEIRKTGNWQVALPVLAAWLPIFSSGVWERSFTGFAGLGLALAAARNASAREAEQYLPNPAEWQQPYAQAWS